MRESWGGLPVAPGDVADAAISAWAVNLYGKSLLRGLAEEDDQICACGTGGLGTQTGSVEGI